MALTTAIEMELTNLSFVDGFDDEKELWSGMAQSAYDYTKGGVPDPKRDDVAPHLALALEAQAKFNDLRASKGLRGKLWMGKFADLIIERTWSDLTKDNGEGDGGDGNGNANQN